MAHEPPEWYSLVIQRLNALVALPLGWDGYTAGPVTLQNAWFALAVLDACCRSNDPMPHIVPGTSGNLQIEWHVDRGDIELHISAPNKVDAWYTDEAHGLDGAEVSLTTDFTIVVRWLQKLTEPTR